MSILALHAGTAYHCESLEGPRYRGFFDALIRPEDLDPVELSAFDVLMVPCRTPGRRLVRHRPLFQTYLGHGGTIVAMGETSQHLWLPGIDFAPEPTNWWWWLEPGASLDIEIADPAHPLFQRLRPDDIAWHLHGSFAPPQGARSLIDKSDGRSVLYVDEITTAGRLIVTSLDPFYHHGSHFMPATTRFLDGFLPWLREDIDRDGPLSRRGHDHDAARP